MEITWGSDVTPAGPARWAAAFERGSKKDPFNCFSVRGVLLYIRNIYQVVLGVFFVCFFALLSFGKDGHASRSASFPVWVTSQCPKLQPKQLVCHANRLWFPSKHPSFRGVCSVRRPRCLRRLWLLENIMGRFGNVWFCYRVETRGKLQLRFTLFRCLFLPLFCNVCCLKLLMKQVQGYVINWQIQRFILQRAFIFFTWGQF